MTAMCLYGSGIVGMLIGALFMAVIDRRLMGAMHEIMQCLDR